MTSGYVRLRVSGVPLDRLGAVGVAAAIATAFTGAAGFNVDVGPVHLFAYRLCLLALLAFWLVCAAISPRQLSLGSVQRVGAPLGFFVVWCAYALMNVRMILSVNDYLVHVGYVVAGTLLMFFTVFYCSDARRLGRLFWMLIVVVMSLLALGVIQHTWGFQFNISQFAQAQGPERYIPMGTFPRVNQYSACLALSSAFLISLAVERRNTLTTIIAVGAVILAAYLVWVTHSRSSLITLGVQILLAAVAFSSSRSRRLGMVGVVLVAVTVLVATPELVFSLVSDMTSVVQRMQAQIVEGRASLGVRFHLILNGLEFFVQSGGFGIGAGNFNAYVEQEGVFSTLYNVAGDRRVITYPHNWWMELLAEYGILVFIGFVLVFAIITVQVVRVYRSYPAAPDRLLGRALCIALPGYIMASVGPGHFAGFRPQWVILALAVAYIAVPRHSAGRPPKRAVAVESRPAVPPTTAR